MDITELLMAPHNVGPLKFAFLENCSAFERYSQQLTKTVMLAARLVKASGAIWS